ncbi:MAG: lactoylglutathione lyase family protein [Herbinix sp.]|nr:lactoylglutathione lyase family protein [Herbinix sp.]
MSLFKCIDCIQLYVSNLEDGIQYYQDCMGLKLLWKTNTSVGLGMQEDITEIVLQSEHESIEIDFKVESVENAVNEIKKYGGTILCGPFDIAIGKGAVIKDKWKNEYVILDMSKGKYVTDKNGTVIAVE